MPRFHDDQVGAARLLLKEVCELLAEHRDDAVLIGGWVPGLLYPTASPPHPGSIDVDVVLRLVMKGLAVHDREEPKDAYDILFCLENFLDGLPALAAEFAPFADDALVQESLRKLGARFRSEYDDGPRRVADFEGAMGEAREIRKRDAFSRVNDFLAIVGQGNGAFLR